MNINAIKKIASGDEGSSSGGGVLPLLGAGGAALLAHSLLSPSDEKEEKEESTLKKALRWLAIAGAGLGGYHLANGMSSTPSEGAMNRIDRAEADLNDSDSTHTALKATQYGANTAGAAALATGLGHSFWRALRNGTGHWWGRGNWKGLGVGAAVGIPLLTVGGIAGHYANEAEIRVKQRERALEELKRQAGM